MTARLSRRTLRRTIGDAKAHFAACVREAEGGRTVIITRHGRPVARLEPMPKESTHDGEAERGVSEEVAEPVAPYAATSIVFETPAARRAALHRRLVEQIWPRIPTDLLGRGVTKQEREEILGYASDGVSPPRAADR